MGRPMQLEDCLFGRYSEVEDIDNARRQKVGCCLDPLECCQLTDVGPTQWYALRKLKKKRQTRLAAPLLLCSSTGTGALLDTRYAVS